MPMVNMNLIGCLPNLVAQRFDVFHGFALYVLFVVEVYFSFASPVLILQNALAAEPALPLVDDFGVVHVRRDFAFQRSKH
jgi:hypothetical protein